MTESLKDISKEQIDALKQQSQAAYDAEVQSRQVLANERPELRAALDQKVHPQSLCGCGCQQIVAGYFCFKSCGSSCSCGPQTETIQISGGPISIGPNAPQSGTLVRFTGHATGVGTSVNIPNIYLQGTVVDAANVIGILFTVNLSIGNGRLSMTLIDSYGRVIATLVHPAQNYIQGQFFGSGSGIFQSA
ncbi:hypothetical protein [Burkholderia seminalis]|uniref:hypothetical protein n=1 Tax=Burkholderia seminalis TaxID=488731 RepID=UPI0015889938|nr:hypothetical protein [Burkholderia seminalis]